MHNTIFILIQLKLYWRGELLFISSSELRNRTTKRDLIDWVSRVVDQRRDVCYWFSLSDIRTRLVIAGLLMEVTPTLVLNDILKQDIMPFFTIFDALTLYHSTFKHFL